MSVRLTVAAVGKMIRPILKAHGIVRAGLFGSLVRGELKKGSDIDVVIQPAIGMTYFDLAELQLELKNRLKKDVDLATYRSLSRSMKPFIMREQVRVV